MKAISLGNHKLSKTAGLLEQATTSVSPYLATLGELFLVEKRVPVIKQNTEKSRKWLYYICDYYIDFWFEFVYPHRSELEMYNTGYVLKKIQSAFIENHVSYVFEAISRENFAAYCAAKNTDFVPPRIGVYWNGSAEIDVVTVDQEHDSIFAGECNYYDKPVPVDVYFNLKKKCASGSGGKAKILFTASFQRAALSKEC
jgi:hypothetical protein